MEYEREGHGTRWLETCKSDRPMKGLAARRLWRLSALVFLPVWIGAIACCSLESLRGHCHTEPTHAEADHSHSHSDPAHADHNHDSPSAPVPGEAPHSEGFCASLASTVLASGFVSVAPPLSENYTAFDATGRLPIAETFSSEGFFRQAERRIWAFAPEVCTGPANRSHAPPLPG